MVPIASHSSTLRWRAHPAAEQPSRAGLALAVMSMVAASCAITGGGFHWFVIAMVVMGTALNRFFFPSTFEITDDGIVARYPLAVRRMAWADVRRFLTDEHGAYLSTSHRASRLDALRGIHVLFGDRRDDVVETIRARLTDAGRDEPA